MTTDTQIIVYMSICFVIAALCAWLVHIDRHRRQEKVTMGDPFAGVRFASPLIIKPEAPAKCHIFRLDMRNHANGKTMYRCRCGAIYRNGPTGWTVTENKGPYRGVCHANRP